MKDHPRQSRCRSFGWSLLVGATCLAGCQTTDQADSGDMASVEISGQTEAQIQRTLAAVFLANNYQQVDRLTFEKQGTHWDSLAYGGWSSIPVWIRMRIHITPAGPGRTLLTCDAFAVVDRNETTMEEEKKLSVAYRSECKKILDQTKARLAAPPAGGAPLNPPAS